MTEKSIILASASTIRSELLDRCGIAFRAIASSVDENHIKSEWLKQSSCNEDIEALAVKLALHKAQDVADNHPACLVIGCDQLMTFDQQIFSKPRNQEELRQRLHLLRGREHRLVTSCQCVMGGEIVFSHTCSIFLRMWPFSDDYIEDYLHNAPSDILSSVGGYKLEGYGLQLFESIKGDYFAALGLPVLELTSFLRSVPSNT